MRVNSAAATSCPTFRFLDFALNAFRFCARLGSLKSGDILNATFAGLKPQFKKGERQAAALLLFLNCV